MEFVQTFVLLWNIAGRYVGDMLPAMFFATIVFFILMPIRKKRLKGIGLYSSFLREVGFFCFFLFCSGLAALTLTPPGFWSLLRSGFLTPWFRGFTTYINWIPLIDLISAFQGNTLNLFYLLGNVVMFIPLGFFPSLLWDKPSWRKAVLIGLGSSLCVEFTQLFVDRSTDIDDLILNTLGALCGYWFYLLVTKLWPLTVSKFRCERRGTPIWTQNRRSNSSPRS